MKEDINNLFERRLIDMTGAEFVRLQAYALASHIPSASAPEVVQAVGMNALAEALSCSPSQVAKMRRDGALEPAIISHVGRNYVFDIQKAREAAIAWKNRGDADGSVPVAV